MNFRPAKKNDLRTVASWVDGLSEVQTWAGPGVSYPIDISTIADEIGFRSDNAFVCEDKNALCAFAQLIERAKGKLHLARLISNPDMRGEGVGRKMCNQLIDEAKRLAATELTLKVYSYNERAILLYQSLGFETVSSETDAGLMEMALVVSQDHVRREPDR